MEPTARMLDGALKVTLWGPGGAYPLHVHSYYSVAVTAPLDEPYEVLITNTRRFPVEVLVSIAGYNVLDGRIADPETDYGIVIDGLDSYTFSHWREGDQRFGPFRFGHPAWRADGSLDASNTPSIRLTAFEEEVLQPASYGLGGAEYLRSDGETGPLRKRTGAITKNGRPKPDAGARSAIAADDTGMTQVMGRVNFSRRAGLPHILDIYYHAR